MNTGLSEKLIIIMNIGGNRNLSILEDMNIADDGKRNCQMTILIDTQYSKFL